MAMARELDGKRIGFIGCGAMARALAGGLRAAGLPEGQLIGSDLSEEQRQQFEAETGAKTSGSNRDVLAASDIVVLCVKPGVVAAVLAELADADDAGRPLWISIAAGIRISALADALPEGARVIRTMPNTPALVRAGVTALCANALAEDADIAAADALFASVGTTWQAPNESMLDAVTGLSGSGPAYVFLILEALGDAGVREGCRATPPTHWRSRPCSARPNSRSRAGDTRRPSKIR